MRSEREPSFRRRTRVVAEVYSPITSAYGENTTMAPSLTSNAAEGAGNRCPSCQELLASQFTSISRGAVCPHCGHALWIVQTSAGMRCYDGRIAAPVEAKVVKVLCEKLGVNQENVAHDSSLLTDLGADSLAIVELIMSLEEELGITISDEEAQQMTTVGDLLDCILGRHGAELRSCK